MLKKILPFVVLFFSPAILLAQTGVKAPSGTLFIIGGGKRGPELMKTMLQTARLQPQDYIVVLPMSSEEPDTAFFYMKESLKGLCKNAIVNFNFDNKYQSPSAIDSLKKARLIFITGGDQTRFMAAVLNTPAFAAIHTAYANGATIGGTSAGAAVMSQYMITGKELLGDTTYNATFKKLVNDNLEVSQGLGLMKDAIVDQHFIVRSRYNRLFSAIAKYPSLPCIGIDEATAIIVHGKNISVAGEGQVIVMTDPKGLSKTSNGLIKLTDVRLSIYTAGDHFTIR